MKINKVFILLFLALFAVNDIYPSANNPNTEQVKAFIRSDIRVIVPLSGTWNRSIDNSNWESVTMPFSEVEDRQVTYSRTIRIEKEMVESHTWHLYFLGFNQQSEIYFNEQFVGRYYSGMSPLFIRIPEKMLVSGTNELRVQLSPIEATNKQIHTQFITAKKRYAGVIRDVYLIGTPPVWISDVQYKTNFSNNYTNANIKTSISISTSNIEQISKYNANDTLGGTLSRSKSIVNLEVALYNKSTGERVASSDAKQISVESERTTNIEVSLNLNSPKLWSPSNPNLYEIRAKLSQSGRTLDDMNIIAGFREITTISGEKSEIILNGTAFQLKGVTYIEDHSTSGQSLSTWRMEEDIQKIKTLGANVVRFRFHPPHPYFANLCDKNGIMMMVELPMYFAPTELLYLDEIRVLMKNYSKQLSDNYSNHPSLIAFGISDGLNEDDYPIELSNEFSKILRTSGRQLIYKIIPFNSDIIQTDGFDIIGIGLAKDYASTAFNSHYVNRLKSLLDGKPFWLSFGTAVQPQNHNGYSDPLSIEHQAYYIRNNINLSITSNSIGSIVNSFNDYRLNHPYLLTNNDEISILTTGVTDSYRNFRLSYQMLQSLFNNEKEPLLNAGSYSENTPIFFIIFGLFLLLILIFIINRFRRFREYLFRSILRPYNFYSDIRDQRIMSSLQSVMLGLIISFTIGMFLASILYFYRMSDVTQFLLMLKIPNNYFQELTYRMIWMPEISFLIISMISFLFVFVASSIIKLFTLFTRARIYYSDCLTITIWSGIPYLALLPFGIVLIRLLALSDFLSIFLLAAFILLNIWVIARMLKASAVVFDKPAGQVYMIGLLLVIIFAGIPIGIYQLRYSLFSYVNYFFEVVL